MVWQTLGMKTISLDLRERILATYDADEDTRDEVARRLHPFFFPPFPANAHF